MTLLFYKELVRLILCKEQWRFSDFVLDLIVSVVLQSLEKQIKKNSFDFQLLFDLCWTII